jgi:hypothetical protein
MKLTRIELCCLRVADGIATPKDFERLKKAGIDPENWRSISSLVREHLLSNITVDFADELMQIVQTPSITLPDLRDFLIDTEEMPRLTDGIMEKIFEEASTFPLPLEVLKETLRDPAPPSLTDMIMESVLTSSLHSQESFGELENRKEAQEFEEVASEELLDAVFSDNEFQETLSEVKDEPFREPLQDDESIEFFPELSEAVRDEWTAGEDETTAKENEENEEQKSSSNPDEEDVKYEKDEKEVSFDMIL